MHVTQCAQSVSPDLMLCGCVCVDGRFKEAAEYYEPLVQSKLDQLLNVPAIVLANLCVCYIMTSQNDQAEALMRQVERQEQQQATAVSSNCNESARRMAYHASAMHSPACCNRQHA